ncbi:MAG: hypothetical protein ABSE64_00650 [Vulcanimicrobiaceae bacterium]|jgi:hypothetical protein
MIEHAFEIRLAIPDNEAYTALATLQRLGVACAGIARTDIHVFGFDDDANTSDLETQLKTVATIFNPNKHRLRAREEPRPNAGEVWISSADVPAVHERVTIGGVELRGVRTAWRATSWRLLDSGGKDVPEPILDQAVETLLCNPAFQRAIKP